MLSVTPSWQETSRQAIVYFIVTSILAMSRLAMSRHETMLFVETSALAIWQLATLRQETMLFGETSALEMLRLLTLSLVLTSLLTKVLLGKTQ